MYLTFFISSQTPEESATDTQTQVENPLQADQNTTVAKGEDGSGDGDTVSGEPQGDEEPRR